MFHPTAIEAFEALTHDEQWGVAFAVRYEVTPAKDARPLAEAAGRLGVINAQYTPLVDSLARSVWRAA